VLPFRDTLASLFFVSVGMLLDVRFLAAHAGLVAVTVVAILVAKTLATAVPAWLTGFPLRTSLLSGAAIAQVGEFSFVLGSRGAEVGLLDPDRLPSIGSAGSPSWPVLLASRRRAMRPAISRGM
jgi:CPA2 family monovalent cation:H+ antiporter-2